MSIIQVLWEGFLQGLLGVWTIARVVIPLMIVLEVFQSNGVLQKLNHIVAKPFKYIGLSEEGSFPVVVAIFFGLTFGSGVILSHIRAGKVTAKETRIIGTFIALAHALVEDTIIFLSLGAPFILLVFPRLFMAYLMSYVFHKGSAKMGLSQRNNVQGVN